MRIFTRRLAVLTPLVLVLFSGSASATTSYSPDPAVAGQQLTISGSIDWAGCSATSGTWTYTRTVTLVAPDGTRTEFNVISESGSPPSGPLTLSGSDTQTLPPESGTYSVETEITVLCGKRAQKSKVLSTVSVAEEATVPVADPLVGSVALAALGGAYLAARGRDNAGVREK